MNDHLQSGTLDDLSPDDTRLDLGSFDGFDPFAGEEPSFDAPAAETTETNVTPLPQPKETPLPSESTTPAPQRVEAPPPAPKPAVNPLLW